MSTPAGDLSYLSVRRRRREREKIEAQVLVCESCSLPIERLHSGLNSYVHIETQDAQCALYAHPRSKP